MVESVQLPVPQAWIAWSRSRPTSICADEGTVFDKLRRYGAPKPDKVVEFIVG